MPSDRSDSSSMGSECIGPGGAVFLKPAEDLEQIVA